MLSFKALSEKKTKVKINPKMNDVMEGGFRATAESGMPITMHSYEKGGKVKKAKKVVSEKNHGEDCDCMKCEKKRRSEDVHDGPDVANEGYKGTMDMSKSHPEAVKKVEDHIAKHFGKKRVPGGKMGVKEELKMTKKEYAKIHKDFKSDDPKKPRTTKYVPGKGTVSMRVKFVDEAKVDQGKDDAAKKNERNQRTFGNRRDSKGSARSHEDTEARRYNTAKGRGVKMKGKKDKTPVNYHKKDSDKRVDALLKSMKEEIDRPYTGPDKKDRAVIKKMDNKKFAAKLADYEKNMDPKKRQALKDKATKGMKFTHESFKRFVECWKTHKKVGMKMKGGKLVNDCRPKNEEVQVTEGSEKSYYLDKDAEKRAQQKARFKAQNKQAAKERAAAKRRKERNDLRRQGKYGAVGGYYVTKHMEREEVEPKLMSFSEMCCGSVKPVMKTVKPMMKKNELMRNIKKEEAYIKNNTQNIYGSQEEVSEKSDQSITETKTSLARFSDLSEVTRQKKEMGYVKGGTKKPTAPKQKDTALDFVKKQITAKYGKGAIMSGGSRQSKKVKGEKSTVGTGKYKKAADDKKQTAADAKKRGFKSTQDYVNTMARYGGKKNYDSGRGLGT